MVQMCPLKGLFFIQEEGEAGSSPSAGFILQLALCFPVLVGASRLRELGGAVSTASALHFHVSLPCAQVTAAIALCTGWGALSLGPRAICQLGDGDLGFN